MENRPLIILPSAPHLIRLLAVVAFLFCISSPTTLAQSAGDLKVEERQAKLESLHKRLYALPLSQDFIYQELMPKIREERKAVTPNFPQRGRNDEETQSNLASWLKNHPDELDAYSKFIEKKIAQFSKSNSRK